MTGSFLPCRQGSFEGQTRRAGFTNVGFSHPVLERWLILDDHIALKVKSYQAICRVDEGLVENVKAPRLANYYGLATSNSSAATMRRLCGSALQVEVNIVSETGTKWSSRSSVITWIACAVYGGVYRSRELSMPVLRLNGLAATSVQAGILVAEPIASC